MNDRIIQLALIAAVLIIAAVLNIMKRHKRNTYTGFTMGTVEKIASVERGSFLAYFVYHVGGTKYTGSTHVPRRIIFSPDPPVKTGMEIPVQYDEEHPDKYIVPDPFQG